MVGSIKASEVNKALDLLVHLGEIGVVVGFLLFEAPFFIPSLMMGFGNRKAPGGILICHIFCWFSWVLGLDALSGLLVLALPFCFPLFTLFGLFYVLGLYLASCFAFFF